MTDTNTTPREAVERIERGIASYRATKRRRHNGRVASRASADDGNDDYDLSSDVPEAARQLRRQYPDFLEDEAYDTRNAVDEGYDGRSGDLGELIQDAAENDQLVELEDGTYEMSSTVKITWSGRSDLLGVVGDDATIYYTGTELDLLFHLDPATVGVIEGVTFDISEQTANGHDSDVGILSGTFTEAFWARDVTIAGERNRYQDLGQAVPEDGVKEPVGYRHTWMVNVQEGATGFVENLRLPDGEVNHLDIDDAIEPASEQPDDPADCETVYCELDVDDNDISYSNFGGSIPIATDPKHDGLVVYKDCHVEGFTDNGFYMSYVPDPNETGKAVLWDCYAANVRGGAMRLGANDTIVGGTAEMHDAPEGRLGKPLDVDRGRNVDVIGLEIDATDYGGNAIQVRTKAKELTLDRVTVRTDDDRSRPVRLSSDPEGPNANVEIKDCYWYDEYDGRDGAAVWITRADVTATNWHVGSEDGSEITLESSGSLELDGTEIDPGTYDAADLGMEDPRPLPEYGFQD